MPDRYQEFHNQLRILLNIDEHEFKAARREWFGVMYDGMEASEAWVLFRGDPFRWFIKAPEMASRAVWSIVEDRA